MPVEITEVMFKYLEIIIAICGGIIAVFFIFKVKHINRSNNDLTQLIVKHNKQKDMISKQTKSLF